jgi:YgiT-type zinc finger domain-containing protein
MTKVVAATHCPTCGRKAMRRVTRDITTRIGKREVIAEGISIDECGQCGERLFDLAALDQIRSARNASRKKRVA